MKFPYSPNSEKFILDSDQPGSLWNMEKEEQKGPNDQERVEEEETEALELVLFQVSECYVYLVRFIGSFP